MTGKVLLVWSLCGHILFFIYAENRMHRYTGYFIIAVLIFQCILHIHLLCTKIITGNCTYIVTNTNCVIIDGVSLQNKLHRNFREKPLEMQSFFGAAIITKSPVKSWWVWNWVTLPLKAFTFASESNKETKEVKNWGRERER